MADKAGRSGAPYVVVVVAIVGLLSTIGAAALGGYWANRSVERQFESQRSAELQDQRRVIYVNYLRATAQLCTAIERDRNVTEAAVEVLNQHSRVLLIAGPDLRAPLTSFTEALTSEDPAPCHDFNTYKKFRDAFVDAAQPDLR